jgi:hypothetical protein
MDTFCHDLAEENGLTLHTHAASFGQKVLPAMARNHQRSESGNEKLLK